jgi:hypothetical protein
MAEKAIDFPWRWTSRTISTNLDVIWGMSVQTLFRSMMEQCGERDGVAVYDLSQIAAS